MTEKRETELRELEYDLAPDEVMDKAKALAEMETKLGELEAERKAVAAKFKFRKGELEEARRELSKAVATGIGTKEIECEWVPMYKQQQWVLQRTDTGDVIEEETMTKDDLQTTMEVGDKEADNDNGGDNGEETEDKPKQRKPRKPRKSRSKDAGAGD